MLAMSDVNWKERVLARYINGKGMCVIARTEIKSGQKIGYYEGEEVSANTMHSLRLGRKIIDGTGLLRNLAHACEPNAYFKDKERWLYSLRNICAEMEVTIDYLNTEPVISAPFSCKCGSPKCRGIICTSETQGGC